MFTVYNWQFITEQFVPSRTFSTEAEAWAFVREQIEAGNHGNKPDGLLIDIFKALGEAEQRGFVDCMQIFEPRRAENDNASKAQPQ